jgi:hypothetical protein
MDDEYDFIRFILFLGKIHFFLFISLSVVLLLNLLIAMMGDTYAKVTSLVCQHSGQGRGFESCASCSGSDRIPFFSLGIRSL